MGSRRSPPISTEAPSRRLARVGLMSVGAALLYGAWALGINWSHGAGMAWRAAGTQAAFSFVATLVMSSIMEAVFVRRPPGAGRIVFTAAVPTLLGIGVLIGAHALAGTPELLLTILPSALVGLVFSTAYSLNLARIDST